MMKALNRPNFRSNAARMRRAETIYKRLFDLSPAPLAVWTPDFRVADCNDTFLQVTSKERDAVVGFDIDEAFPGNPDDPTGDGSRQVIASFERVLRSGGRDTMPAIRHDVARPDGSWEERHWLVVNTAVRDDGGSLLAVVEQAIDARGLVATSYLSPLDQLADALIRAHGLNEDLGDPEVKAAIERALLRVGQHLWKREVVGTPPGLLN